MIVIVRCRQFYFLIGHLIITRITFVVIVVES